jgi:hypothetical protein
MINFNPDLTQDQARYILEEVFPKEGYRIDHKTLSWWAQAHNYAFKEQVGVPGCSCEYIQTYNVWRSRLGQYNQQIREIAYPPVKTETGETGISNGKPKSSGKAGRKPKAQSGLTE